MDPISMAMMGTSVLSGLFSGITGMFGQNQRAAEDKAAAQQAENEAGVNADEALLSGDATAARAATQAAANGGGFGGTTLGVISQASERAMFNARTETYKGLTTARSDLYDAQVAKINGTDAMIGGLIQGAGSAASQGANMAFRQSILGNRQYMSGDAANPYLLQGLW